ncbi:MAG: OmpA family protein [Saprospiraceae bacterium]|nr:OmpA family protein [Saprospiraceae bacterium]
MTAFVIIVIIILLAIVVVQIGKVTELSARIRGEEEVEMRNNRLQGRWLMVFMVAFLVLCFLSAGWFKNWMLGYGPHEAASEHGKTLDSLFNLTLFFTGIVFVLTHVALFYFSWKYHGRKNRKASFIAHNNTLEIVWSAIPAVVMTLLVVKGLIAWNEVMADVGPDEEHIEIEATGYQFAWHLRYPGPDGALGTRDFRKITGLNPLGQDWTDPKNLDDFHPDEIVLPVGTKVRVRITARDVLHNFYLPHFRVKMDAVPGIPTYFVFTPTKTTEEYREELSQYPEYQVPADPTDPESPMLWEIYNYELACAELCGASHFSMRRIVRIVSEGEYQNWLATQQSYYMNNIRGTDADPLREQVLDVEIAERREDFNTRVESALASDNPDDKVIQLDHLFFESGSANLTDASQYELDNIVQILNRYPDMQIEIGGHTDNTGDAESNLTLSRARAAADMPRRVSAGIAEDRLTAVGYGQTRPVADNDTEDGRAANRRTELKITAQ